MNVATLMYMTVGVILPLLPAYLLYRLLPSESHVEGPWHGLKIKLGGAFAGYFLLVVTIFAFAKSLPSYEVWTVRGRILLADEPDFVAELAEFRLIPSGVTILPDGRFALDVFAQPDKSSGLFELPFLVVSYAGYRPTPVSLEDAGMVEKNGVARRVVLRENLVLKPDPNAPHEHQ